MRFSRKRVDAPTAKELAHIEPITTRPEAELAREDQELVNHHVEAWVDTVQIQPSRKMLKVRGLTQRDWKDHVKSLVWIRKKAKGCTDGEHEDYHRAIDNHMRLAVCKFGVQLIRPLAY